MYEILDCGNVDGNRYQIWRAVQHADDTTRVASEFVCSTDSFAKANEIVSAMAR